MGMAFCVLCMRGMHEGASDKCRQKELVVGVCVLCMSGMHEGQLQLVGGCVLCMRGMHSRQIAFLYVGSSVTSRVCRAPTCSWWHSASATIAVPVSAMKVCVRMRVQVLVPSAVRHYLDCARAYPSLSASSLSRYVSYLNMYPAVGLSRYAYIYFCICKGRLDHCSHTSL